MTNFTNPIQFEAGNGGFLRIRAADTSNNRVVVRADIVDEQDTMLYTDDVRVTSSQQRRAFVRSASERASWLDTQAVDHHLTQLGTSAHQYLPQEESTEQVQPERRGDPASRTATRLVEIAEGLDLEVFHTPGGEPVATVAIDGIRQTWLVRSEGFKSLMTGCYFQRDRQAVSQQAWTQAADLLAARATHDGPERPVYRRVAKHEGRVYLDLANERWEAVEMSPDGWRVVSNPPVCFVRPAGSQSIPTPVPAGSIQELRSHINAPDEDTWVLMVAWLVASMYPTGPYPVLNLIGEQGSAKSTTARMLIALVDPKTTPLRTPPRSEQDIFVAASHSQVLAYDNLSQVRQWTSDALCRVSTGGGFSTRRLYTDSDEATIEAIRPVLLTGITDLVGSEDLLDRSLIVRLPRLPEGARRTEIELWQDFEQDRPRILGALCGAICEALRNWESVRAESYPRMADFTRLILAAEPALPWRQGRFSQIYADNRLQSVRAAVENSPVAAAVQALMRNTPSWQGTPTELLDTLNGRNGPIAAIRNRADRAWPRTPNWLTNKLRRATPFLAQLGIDVRERRGDQRIISLTRR